MDPTIQSAKPGLCAGGLTRGVPLLDSLEVLEPIGSRRDADLWDTFQRDDILTTAMLYWVPRRVLSSIRLYWETFSNVPSPAPPIPVVTVPTGIVRFKGSGSTTRADLERGFNLVHYTEPPRGGHYGALEQPELFAADVAMFFSKL